MNLNKLVEKFEARRDTYRKIWKKLTKTNKFFIVMFVIIGIINIMIGSVIIWSNA